MFTIPDNVLFRPLGRRPEASTLTVRDLVSKVLEGRIRVPHFQRPLRWSNADVVKLFDSLWRGYPAGSLLFWKRPAPAERITVGGAQVEAQALPDAWYVVDGQQRTTALAAALLELAHGRDRKWAVWFDPALPGFVGEPPTPDRVGQVVPLSALGEMRRLNRWLREAALEGDALDAVEDAQQRILDYAFPIYLVDTDDEQALRAAFARLNSSGARMRQDEVFAALLGTKAINQQALDLEALEAWCNLDGFGAPSRGDVLKAVLAMSGLDPSRRLQDLSASDIARLVDKDAACAALAETVAFLQRDCGVPHVRLIPYPVVFSLLARWFHLFPDPSAETRAALARWVWRGAATGAHQRAEVSKMRAQVSSIREDDETGSLDALLREVDAPPPRRWSLKAFNAKSAHSRIETLALLAAAPADLDGPLSVAALMSEDRVAKEVFASPEWDGLEAADRALAKSCANRILFIDGHTGLHHQLRRWPAGHAALASHLIDDDGFEALCAREIPTFLRRRAERVAEAVDAWLEDRAGWDRPALAPLDSYLDDEGEDDSEPPEEDDEPLFAAEP